MVCVGKVVFFVKGKFGINLDWVGIWFGLVRVNLVGLVGVINVFDEMVGFLLLIVDDESFLFCFDVLVIVGIILDWVGVIVFDVVGFLLVCCCVCVCICFVWVGIMSGKFVCWLVVGLLVVVEVFVFVGGVEDGLDVLLNGFLRGEKICFGRSFVLDFVKYW